MTKFFALVTTLALLATLPGCASETTYGKCVGVAQGDRRDPKLVYDLSIWNTFWSVVGFELIFPPILLLHHELYCPTGRRKLPAEAPPPGTPEKLPPTNVLGETQGN